MTANCSKPIVIVSQHFYPSCGATSQLITDLSLGLKHRGHNIIVLTATPAENPKDTAFVDRIDPEKSLPICRFARQSSPSSSIRAKLFDGLFFVSHAAYWLLLNSNKAESILFVSNPPFVGLIGTFILRIRKTPYRFLFQDIFPSSATSAGILPATGIVFYAWKYLVHSILNHARATIVLSNSMLSHCKYLFAGVPNLYCVPNWSVIEPCNLNKNESPFTDRWNLQGRLVVQYSGNFGRLHDIMTILEAARLSNYEETSFLFIGGGAKRQQILAYKNHFKMTNILIKDYQSIQDLPHTLSVADLCVVSLTHGSHRIVAPSKYYGILASQRPVILIADLNYELAKELRAYNAGVVVEPGDPVTLANHIAYLAKHPSLLSEMGRNAGQLYSDLYGKNKSIDSYSTLLSS